MSTSEVFKQFHPDLIEVLPMNDELFLINLVSCGLLPGDLLNQIKTKETPAEKAKCYLSNKISHDVSEGDFESFHELLNIMEESGNDNAQALAKIIKNVLKEEPVVTCTDDNNPGEPSTKKQKTTTPLDKATDKLSGRCQRQLSTAIDEYSWPKHDVLTYVKLALVECKTVSPEDEYIDDLTQLTLQGGGVDMIMKKKKPISDLREIFHYNNELIPRLILIMGAPGIGKTTLANEICKKWAKEKFLSDDFNTVILIALRAVQKRSLEEVIIEQIEEKAYQELTKTAGEKCLIILEGFDELAPEKQQGDPLLLNLINLLAFEKAVILITSRPHACQELNANRRIEIVGFGKEQIKSFVELSFPGETQTADTFMDQLMEHPHIYSLCYIPISLVMIINIFKLTKHSLPSTLTKLYQVFTVMKLKREEKRQRSLSSAAKLSTDIENICCSALPDIPKEAVVILFSLSKLAFYGFFEKKTGTNTGHTGQGWRKLSNTKMIFNQNDFDQCNIEITGGEGLLKVVTINGLFDDCVTYNFIHLTVQEFLCAVYMLTLSQEEQYHLLNEYFDDYPNIMILYCGLTKLDLREVVYSKLKSHYSAVTAVKCLYEGRWNVSPHRSMHPFEMNMSYITLLPYDCLCLSYVFCHYPVTKLNLYMCYIKDNLGMLAKWCLNTTTMLEELDLGENNLTGQGMENVMKIVKSSPSLRVLDVSENDIRDDGVFFCLQHTNTLTKISFEFCGFSAKGASYIKTILIKTSKLDFLHIGKNYIGDDGIKHITEGLQNNKTLTILTAYDCGFSIEGVRYISEMFKMNQTLRYLNINSNPIGDEGIAVITRTIHISRISQLVIYNCNITDTGAVSISEMIKMHNILEYLNISSNPIGDKGITAIAKTLNNSSISELIVYNCNITVVGANKLAESLKYNHTIKILKLEDNDITVNGAIVTLEAAVANKICQKVDIKDEYKSDDKVKEMMSILEERKRQEENNETKPSEDHHRNVTAEVKEHYQSNI